MPGKSLTVEKKRLEERAGRRKAIISAERATQGQEMEEAEENNHQGKIVVQGVHKVFACTFGCAAYFFGKCTFFGNRTLK
jgi:hypothetical protein